MSILGVQDELAVSVPIRFLSIRAEKISPTRSHVASHVLHDYRDAVRFRIENGEDLLVLDLTNSLVR